MIYLVRHGESQANISKRYSGITDVELSLLGRNQACIAGANLKTFKISHVFSSPLKRALDTAKIISKQINFNENEIIIEKNLMEVNFGLFENMTWEEMQVTYKEETERWIREKLKYRFPQGESYEDVIERICLFTDKIPDNSVVVTHFGVIQSILLHLKIADELNLWDYHISNCDIVVLNNKEIVKIIKCA